MIVTPSNSQSSPRIAGCPSSGPVPIATGQVGVFDVTLHGDLVYGVGGSYGNLIRAVAKP
jgi:hypothetical protein